MTDLFLQLLTRVQGRRAIINPQTTVAKAHSQQVKLMQDGGRTSLAANGANQHHPGQMLRKDPHFTMTMSSGGGSTGMLLKAMVGWSHCLHLQSLEPRHLQVLDREQPTQVPAILPHHQLQEDLLKLDLDQEPQFAEVPEQDMWMFSTHRQAIIVNLSFLLDPLHWGFTVP